MIRGVQVDTGDVLCGRYRLEHVLGRGGMGVVYLARDERLGRQVAIKLLTVTEARSTQADRDGLVPQKEARALAALNHPNLVTLLDYEVTEDGTPALVMEHVDGYSLGRLIGPYAFDSSEIALVLYQTAAALHCCHSQGVIHRDLKPGNLLVHANADPGLMVKVIDFGLTKLLADRGATALTVGGKVFGSPRFMAPEQWLRKRVDGRTDLYALGLVGFCMALGRHFIEATNPVDIFRAHVADSRPRLYETTRGEPLPADLAAAISRAAHPDINQRFPDAAAFQAALEPFVRGLRVDFQPEKPHGGEASLAPAPAPFIEAAVSDAVTGSFDGSMVADPIEGGDPEALETLFEAPRIRVPVGVDPLATIASAPPPMIAASDPQPSEAEEEAPHLGEPVMLGFAGGRHTAITKEDVERAVRASKEPPAAAPPDGVRTVETGPPVPDTVSSPHGATVETGSPVPDTVSSPHGASGASAVERAAESRRSTPRVVGRPASTDARGPARPTEKLRPVAPRSSAPSWGLIIAGAAVLIGAAIATYLAVR